VKWGKMRKHDLPFQPSCGLKSDKGKKREKSLNRCNNNLQGPTRRESSNQSKKSELAGEHRRMGWGGGFVSSRKTKCDYILETATKFKVSLGHQRGKKETSGRDNKYAKNRNSVKRRRDGNREIFEKNRAAAPHIT